MNSKRTYAWVARLAVVALCTVAGVLLLASRSPKAHAQNHIPVSMTTDWSNRHMVYSAPSSVAQSLRLQAEPRYLHQLTRRNSVAAQ
jgi:hypothetical protein